MLYNDTEENIYIMGTSFVQCTLLFSVLGEENLFCKFVLHLMGNPINDNIMGISFVLCFDLLLERKTL